MLYGFDDFRLKFELLNYQINSYDFGIDSFHLISVQFYWEFKNAFKNVLTSIIFTI